jgi:hypothetical protein
MTPDQERDLEWINEEIRIRLNTKYRAGQKEHGGNGWEMGLERLLLENLNEHLDGAVYTLWALKNVWGRGDRE